MSVRNVDIQRLKRHSRIPGNVYVHSMMFKIKKYNSHHSKTLIGTNIIEYLEECFPVGIKVYGKEEFRGLPWFYDTGYDVTGYVSISNGETILEISGIPHKNNINRIHPNNVQLGLEYRRNYILENILDESERSKK